MDLTLISLESFESVCRTCMRKGPLISIFLTNKKYALKFSEMLYYCAAVQANEGDNLPPHICKQCKTNLIAMYKFKHTALNSEAILRQILMENSKKDEFKHEKPEDFRDMPSPMEAGDDLDFTLTNTATLDLPCNTKRSNTSEDLKPAVEVIKVETPILHEIPVNDAKLNSCKSYSSQQEQTKKKLKSSKGQLKEKQTMKTFQCEVCGKFLSCRSNLVQHMRRHTGEKPFSCDLCKKKFARAEHVTIHRRIHTGERPYSCTLCPKSFVQYAALTAHLRIHNGERPHMCAICGKSFSQSVSLTYHTRTHTGETPFKCKICSKGFAHSGNLNIHMRFHRNERPFVCNVCGRRFVTSSHLTVHIKQHTGDRPHKCNLCGKAFARSEHLKDHLVIHTGQKPHACKLCPKRYTQSSHLNRHMKTHKS